MASKQTNKQNVKAAQHTKQDPRDSKPSEEVSSTTTTTTKAQRESDARRAYACDMLLPMEEARIATLAANFFDPSTDKRRRCIEGGATPYDAALDLDGFDLGSTNADHVESYGGAMRQLMVREGEPPRERVLDTYTSIDTEDAIEQGSIARWLSEHPDSLVVLHTDSLDQLEDTYVAILEGGVAGAARLLGVTAEHLEAASGEIWGCVRAVSEAKRTDRIALGEPPSVVAREIVLASPRQWLAWKH